ncbi:hypothetical protein [Planococcus notacanthi]|nr:hypothetical protein [Planococcus sp. APC 4016]
MLQYQSNEEENKLNIHIDQTIQSDKGEVVKMITKYDEYLRKAKKFNYSIEKYRQLEEMMTVAKKAKFPLSDASEVTDRFEFAISLASAMALYDTHKVKGNDGRIVYLNHKEELVYFYADGRIEIIEKKHNLKSNQK